MPARRRPDPKDLARARQLLRAHGRWLRADERRLLERLLDRIGRGAITRQEALAELARPLRRRGLSAAEALRLLRATPYYPLVERLLPRE